MSRLFLTDRDARYIAGLLCQYRHEGDRVKFRRDCESCNRVYSLMKSRGVVGKSYLEMARESAARFKEDPGGHNIGFAFQAFQCYEDACKDEDIV